jgi:NAD(P)H-nitrite reductase large subunit
VEVKRMVEENGWTTLEQIAQSTNCGTGCGLCRPYLQRMLDTGETAFAWVPPSHDD